MKAYLVALPCPDGDGYIALNNLAFWARSGDLQASLAKRVLEHRFRLGERTANLPAANLGVIH